MPGPCVILGAVEAAPVLQIIGVHKTYEAEGAPVRVRGSSRPFRRSSAAVMKSWFR